MEPLEQGCTVNVTTCKSPQCVFEFETETAQAVKWTCLIPGGNPQHLPLPATKVMLWRALHWKIEK